MSPLATSAAEVVARLRANPALMRAFLRRAVASRSRRRRAAAVRIARRLR